MVSAVTAWLRAGLICLLAALVACGESESRFVAGDRAAIPGPLREPAPGARPVEIAPAGTWYVRQPPRRFVAYQSIEAEIALALGVGDGLVAMFDRPHLATLDRLFYSQLPGFGRPLDDVMDLPFGDRVDRELFLSLEAEAALIDPRLPIAHWGWSPEELGRVAGHLGPFVGNFIRYPRDGSWGPSYQRYTIEQYAGRLAQLFRAEDRWRRLARFRDGTLAAVQDRLPPQDQRPAICVLNINSDPETGRFYLVDIAGGARSRHYRDLGLQTAADETTPGVGKWGVCDYETLAAIDPPVLVVQWALSKTDGPEDFRQRFVEPMQAHPIGRRLRAVRENRIWPGGTGEQGPITHLFQVEMTAQQLFPDEFGAWRWGEVPAEPLFDREALVAIVGATASAGPPPSP